MIELINQVSELGGWNVLVCFCLVLCIIVTAVTGSKKLLSTLGLRTEKSIKEESIENRLNDLKSEIDTLKLNRVNDREQSFEIQKQLTKRQENIDDSLVKIKEMVNDLSKSMSDMQDKNDFKERAKLKDRISQSYRFYHKEQKWTSMDKESFNDLIRSYEAAGGKNSFVHSTCEPESETWEIIDE